jgi:hypothetical protein
MMPSLRAKVLGMVERVQTAAGSEEELDELLVQLERLTGNPHVSSLIYWPATEGFDDDLTAEEITDAALAYRPFALGPGRASTTTLEASVDDVSDEHS